MCNSHHGALMQLMHLKPINCPHGFQKPIKEVISTIPRHDVQIPQKILHRCYGLPTTISPPLKKLCINHHYKVIEDPYGGNARGYPQGPLLLSPWLRRGFLARLLGFLLDIWSLVDSYSLKILGSSRAKIIKSILCYHLKDDGEAQTWLVIVNVKESSQSPLK